MGNSNRKYLIFQMFTEFLGMTLNLLFSTCSNLDIIKLYSLLHKQLSYPNLYYIASELQETAYTLLLAKCLFITSMYYQKYTMIHGS